MIGYAFSGSFCTFERSYRSLERLIAAGYEVQPIMSERAFGTDTRFASAVRFREKISNLCKRDIIHTVEEAEPLGPKVVLDALVIAPCTGNTLAKIATGVTDTAVTMAAKAHLRCDRTLVLAVATNDALSQNLKNIGTLVTRRSVYFVPMLQDDPIGKPHSLVAAMEEIPEALEAALEARQLRPIFRV